MSLLEDQQVSLESAEDRLRFFWSFVDDINWAERHDEGNDTIDEIELYVLANYTRGQAEVIRERFDDFRGLLRKRILNYFVDSEYDYIESDDGVTDLVAHIIGLGEAEYNRVMSEPELGVLRARRGDFSEGFQYCVPYLSDYDDMEGAKPLEDLQSRAYRLKEKYESARKGLESKWFTDKSEPLEAILSLLSHSLDVESFVYGYAEEAKELSEEICNRIKKLGLGGVAGGNPLNNKWCVWNLVRDAKKYQRYQEFKNN